MNTMRVSLLALFCFFTAIRTANCQPATLIDAGFFVRASSASIGQNEDGDGFALAGNAPALTVSAETGEVDAQWLGTNGVGTPSSATALGNAKAKAAVGALGVAFDGSADVQVAGGADFDFHVHAEWEDTVTLHSPRFSSAHPLIIDAPLLLDGDMFVIPGDLGGGYIQLFLQDQDTNNRSLPPDPIPANPLLGIPEHVWGLALNDVLMPPPTSISTTKICTTGIPCTVGYILEIQGDGRTSGGGTEVTHANFYNTLSWGGITSVRDGITGEPIDDWTITSESGFDYSKPFPVPEPPTVALLLSLVGLHFVRPRSHRHGRG
jgi:hypothetical protein